MSRKERKRRSGYTSEEIWALWPGLCEKNDKAKKAIREVGRGLALHMDALEGILGAALRVAKEGQAVKERLQDAERLNKVLSRRVGELERRLRKAS